MIPLHILHQAEPAKAGTHQTRWEHFTSMPHHPMFALGAVQAVLVMVWWLIDLGGRYGGWYTPAVWSISSPWAHLYLMIYSLFPPYMFGFLMTTYPKWMDGVPVDRRHYLPAASLLAAAVMTGYAGLATGMQLMLPALALHLAGWGMGLYALLRVYIGASRPDTIHARITSGVLLTGWLLLLSYTAGVAGDHPLLVDLARSGGIWWFLYPVFFAVSHRLIPFFSNSVLPGYTIVRPDWALWIITAGGLIHGGLELAGLTQWTWAVDLPMAATSFWLTIAWRIRQSFHVRILAMLHLGFLWLGIALALYGLQSLALLTGHDLTLGRAPLHALMIGYFSSMLVAMSTRVTLGHSGRPLTADNRAWMIFIAIQLTALVRVLADLPGINRYAGHLYLCAALLWLLAFSGWLLKFTPIYWQQTKQDSY